MLKQRKKKRDWEFVGAGDARHIHNLLIRLIHICSSIPSLNCVTTVQIAYSPDTLAARRILLSKRASPAEFGFN
jgi:hypothetical protein